MKDDKIVRNFSYWVFSKHGFIDIEPLHSRPKLYRYLL